MSGVIWGHWGQKVNFTKNAIFCLCYIVWPYDPYMLISFRPSTLCYRVTCQSGVIWGHWGQKFIFTKKASSPSDYVVLTRDLCICSSLTPSTNVMVLKNCPGSFGVTGVKSSFSLKMLFFVHFTLYNHKTHTCSSAWDPLPMLWCHMTIWGHLGSLGSLG